MTKIDPYFADELKKYGTDDFTACFNCGNCTAVCSLTDKSVFFPRMMIRMGMLGLKEEILSQPEPWLCYACGDCSETCPRQADPGQFMAAIRRYAVAAMEPTGITKMMFKNNPLSLLITLIIAGFLGFFLLTLKPETNYARWLFNYLPYGTIHDLGLIVFGITGISAAWGVVKMSLKLKKAEGKVTGKAIPVSQAINRVIRETAMLKRYQSCDKEADSYWHAKPFYLKPWFIHWSIMWGFIGLLAATTLNFLLKDPETTVWWPSRILGSLAGILMVYGSTLAIWYRLKKVTKVYDETQLADWIFLLFLWVAGITGFWLEIAVFLNADTLANHLIFLFHTVISMELVLLFAFSKFAHAFYRPLALYFYYRRQSA